MTTLYTTTSGFYPMFSPDGRYVLCGNGQYGPPINGVARPGLKLVDLQTKTERPIGQDLKGFVRGGWYANRQVLLQNDDGAIKGDGFLYRVEVKDDGTNGPTQVFKNDGNYKGAFRAWLGHWCVVKYREGLCLDGVWLGPGYNNTDLSDLLCASNYEANGVSRVRLIDTTTRVITDVVPKVGPNVVRASRDYVSYGYFGVSALRVPDGTQGFVNITNGESPCKVVFGPNNLTWVVTAAEINGVAYMLARPLGHAQPTAIIFPHGAVQVDAVAVGDTFRVAGDLTNGHLAIYEAAFTDPLTRLPAPPVEPPVPVTPVNRACHFGGFVFKGLHMQGLKSNCELRVEPTGPSFLWQGAVKVAVYVAGTPDGDLGSLERAILAAKVHGLPVAAYWPRSLQINGSTVPRGADIIAVEAYQQEPTLAGWEARVRASLKRCSAAWIIAQCYTSNPGNTSDLAPLVPVYSKLLNAFPAAVGCILFSGAGRATGLEDHPEVLDEWSVIANSVKTPEIPVPANAKATISSYEANITLPDTCHAVAKVTEGSPTHFRWQYQKGHEWETSAEKPASQLTYDYPLPEGTFAIRLQTLVNGQVTDTSSSTSRVVTVSKATTPPPVVEPPPTMQPIAQYPEFVHREIPMVSAAYRTKHGRRPGDVDFAHNAWRLLSEGWTPDDASADILNPPVAGHGKRRSYPLPVMPYDQWVNTDYPSIINAYRSYYGHEPGDIDYAHLAWRPLAERWTVRDVIHDIKGEPLEDGGPSGATPPGSLPPPVGTWDGALGVDGRTMTRGGQIFRPVGISSFVLAKLFVDGKRQQAEDYLGWMLARRFNFGRIFLSGKGWNELNPQAGLGVLPDLLAWLKSHGVGVEITAITGSKAFDDSGFTNWEPFLREAGRIGHDAGNATLEAANEFYHGTQSGAVHDVENLKRWCRGLPLPWAVGAAPEDEPIDGGYEGAGGTYATAHLDRGREYWEQVRRVREIHAIYSAHRVPAWDNERIGAASYYESSKRMNDPVFFLTAGLLDRCFETPGIHHTQSGLECTVPQGIEALCADAFVRGMTGIVPADFGVLQYQNAGHTSQGSPVESFENAVRCYSFIEGGRGVNVVIGGSDATTIKWANSFQPVEKICDEQATGPESDNLRVIVSRIEKR